MKYYIIAGEASGDLHGSNLMKSLAKEDPKAEFRFFGGDKMQSVGGTLVRHYRHLAYMGFIPVLLHLRSIFAQMRKCKSDILLWKPDALILVDYPGFNLSIAQYIHAHSQIPVFYYISPKVWAWKEYRVKNIRRDVTRLFSILPFEIPFFARHGVEAEYVGNPCVDAITAYCAHHPEEREIFLSDNSLSSRPIVALLAGSRKQEIASNLPLMLEAMCDFPDYQVVIAGAPGMDESFYRPFLQGGERILFDKTYSLLMHSHAALVTSGTATLETALFGVPQVVCYATPMPRLYGWLRRLFLKVRYVSLVNLIADREVVTELVADTMNLSALKCELTKLLPTGSSAREEMKEGYRLLCDRLGAAGASDKAACSMIRFLQSGL